MFSTLIYGGEEYACRFEKKEDKVKFQKHRDTEQCIMRKSERYNIRNTEQYNCIKMAAQEIDLVWMLPKDAKKPDGQQNFLRNIATIL